jgi:hypothetical protein
VVPHLKPSELVAAILLEFRELAYLSDKAADYHLLRGEDGLALDETKTLEAQLSSQERLSLVEQAVELPAGTQAPSRHLYLREQRSGHVYKLHWLPAIIGRPDTSLPYDDRLAVNLQPLETGMRVSRRHAEVSEEDGQFYIRSISKNPTGLVGDKEVTNPIGDEKTPLHDGDVIRLERSGISVAVIIRPDRQG